MTSKYHIGIDLGGTKIEVAILNSQNEILFRERLLTEAHLGAEHIFNQIHALYAKALICIQNKTHTLGLGTPGSISNKTRLLKNSNTLCLNGLPLQSLLEDKLVHDILIENDANCFALAEALMGSGKGYPFVFGVIMGSGCGGGIVFDGKIRQGPQNIAGEWGHMVIDPQGAHCYCGANGCVESFISGGGLEKRIKDKTGNTLSAQKFFNNNLKDQALKDIKQDFYARFGQALANLINILDPDIVVLGGGLSNEKSLYKKGIAEVYQRIFNDIPTTPIVKNKLGDSAGVIGAALISQKLIQ
ncbi:MAG: ROK family protein [Candidatus Methylopumilus sp.]|nr:ROK family protein [Candidatus Methylopumilus sp.]